MVEAAHTYSSKHCDYYSYASNHISDIEFFYYNKRLPSKEKSKGKKS